MTELQHVCVKILAEPQSTIDWPALIPVFHRWIQDQAVPEMLIDVADYTHVPNGPGVLLIGHEAFYAVDNTAGELGLLYNRRAVIEGDTPAKIALAFASAVRAADRLQAEPELNGCLRFNARDCEVFVNDRLLAPNTKATYDSLAPVVQAWFEQAWLTRVKTSWNPDARGLFRLRVRPA